LGLLTAVASPSGLFIITPSITACPPTTTHAFSFINSPFNKRPQRPPEIISYMHQNGKVFNSSKGFAKVYS
jgi:hypothetical protein